MPSFAVHSLVNRYRLRGHVRRYALTGHEPFLNAIAEKPSEPGPHLVFADWLEEQGHPLGPVIREAASSGSDFHSTHRIIGTVDTGNRRQLAVDHPAYSVFLGDHAGLKLFASGSESALPDDPVYVWAQAPDAKWGYHVRMAPAEALALTGSLSQSALLEMQRHLSMRHPEHRLEEEARREIVREAQRGAIPANVPHFAALHDHVDANMLGGDENIERLAQHHQGEEYDPYDPEAAGHFYNTEGFTAAMNRIQANLDAWIRSGGLRRAVGRRR